MRPAYMTAIRSARPATTPRSWVIQTNAEPRLCRKMLYFIQDLRLDGDVERRGGFVGDDQFGAVQQRDRDCHALAHPAGELVRIGRQALVRRRDSDKAQRVTGALARRSPADLFVGKHRLDHLRLDGQDRIERHHRVLKDHRDPSPAQAAHLLGGNADDVLAVKKDAAVDNAAGRINQPEHREAGDRLS